ncbi:7191_t:CDS:2 [Dentiscutata erythropus]|uniref:7191_t:CDS:1 n=1 Tax=Dentiscutata erythropus TaxID=1348616 RepID=A0A9N8ZAT0_9GLOM|nr:7191_t:CDS:2 [Dentiscutata erythropus]
MLSLGVCESLQLVSAMKYLINKNRGYFFVVVVVVHDIYIFNKDQ